MGKSASRRATSCSQEFSNGALAKELEDLAKEQAKELEKEKAPAAPAAAATGSSSYKALMKKTKEKLTAATGIQPRTKRLHRPSAAARAEAAKATKAHRVQSARREVQQTVSSAAKRRTGMQTRQNPKRARK